MIDELSKLPLPLWILIAILLLAQGTWLFIDARKHTRYYWFWGLWGLIYFPLPLILYALIVRKMHRRLFQK